MSDPRKLQTGIVGTDGSHRYRVHGMVAECAVLKKMDVSAYGHFIAEYHGASYDSQGRELPEGWYIGPVSSGIRITFLKHTTPVG
jgi:hypothetical protein